MMSLLQIGIVCMPVLTQEILKKHLRYNPLTGKFIRLKNGRNGYFKIGDNPVKPCSDGRQRISLLCERYRVHRLVFLYMTGKFPVYEVDHINGIQSDNSWSNLRDVKHIHNMRNQKLPTHNTSGRIGVWFDKERNKWAAEISILRKKRFLGRFLEKSDAIIARKEAEILYGFHENHGRIV